MNRMLSIKVWWVLYRRGSLEGAYDLEEPTSTNEDLLVLERIVPIAEFEYDKLVEQWKHDAGLLAKAIWDYGDFHDKLMAEYNDKLRYNALTAGLKENRDV